MNWSKAQNIESTVWEMKLNDLPRASNRALIDSLFNGAPPYSDRQVRQNQINVNVNNLIPTKIAQDAQGQFINAVFSPSQYFSVKVDDGPKHKRDQYSTTITDNLRRAMKRGKSAKKYRENLRNIFAQLVLHGIGPMIWNNTESWCPEMVAIGDMQVPSQTLCTLDNLSYLAVYRRYTAYRLWEMTHGPRVDPGWDVKVADNCIEWARKQWGQTNTTDELWSPERVQEDFKSDGGLWNSDAVPTINCWDFYALDDDEDQGGVKRRIVLDTPSFGEMSDYEGKKVGRDTKNFLDGRDQFLFNSGDRLAASGFSELVHFQFANGSMVAPFRYHSVRSLGWLLYAVCHLQNRLSCALTEAAFEACMQYFRVANADDGQRALKIDLINKMVIPDGVSFVGAQDRWKVDINLVETVMAMNQKEISDNSVAYTRDFGSNERQPKDKTATQINAEVQAASALLGSMLEQFYGNQDFQGREICRRFCIPNSRDIDVQKFRLRCLKAGVPEDLLDVEKWDVSTERIMGSGNQQLAIGQAQAIMQQYPLLDPNGKRVALRKYMFAVTRDAATTEALAPDEPILVTKSIHDAQLSVATLLAGQPMGLVQDVSHAEYAGVLIGALNLEIQKITQVQNGVPTPVQMAGLQNLAGQTVDGQPLTNQDGSPGNGAMFHMELLSQDKGEKATLKALGDLLSKSMNQVRAFGQRLQGQQQQGPQNGNGQPALDPKDAVRLKGQLLLSQAKAANMRESHAQRAQQKAEIHQQKMQEDQNRSQLSNAQEIRRAQVGESVEDLKAAATIKRTRRKQLLE